MIDLSKAKKVLIIAAHADDFEIGCLGLARRLSRFDADLSLVVMSSNAVRKEEQKQSVSSLDFKVDLSIHNIPDTLFPNYRLDIKQILNLYANIDFDLVLSHSVDDAHQDHTTTAQLTYNAFRNIPILEYEIPKYDVDCVRNNFYINLTEDEVNYKCMHLVNHFPSQQSKSWYDYELFKSLARLRGLHIHSRYAEAFNFRKLWV